jgi:hypothetical protein
MKLEEAQLKLQRLLEARQQMEQSGEQSGQSWTARAVYLLTALLPILAWPESSVLRGEPDSLLQLDELIRRANISSGALSNNAWESIRAYLGWLPGLRRETDSGQIVFSNSVPRKSVFEHHEYVLMQLN